MTATPPPSPEAATDVAGFMAALRRLKTWSGLSFRALERRASAAGDVLPYSTASTMLGRDRLPREELLLTFVRACGLDGDAARSWVTARAEIAGGGAASPEPPGGGAAVRGRLRAAARRRPVVVVAAALIMSFAGGAAFAANVGIETTATEETVTLGP